MISRGREGVEEGGGGGATKIAISFFLLFFHFFSLLCCARYYLLGLVAITVFLFLLYYSTLHYYFLTLCLSLLECFSLVRGLSVHPLFLSSLVLCSIVLYPNQSVRQSVRQSISPSIKAGPNCPGRRRNEKKRGNITLRLYTTSSLRK